MKVKVYVLSFLREYADDMPFWGVEGVFATEVEARSALKKVFDETENNLKEYDDVSFSELHEWSASIVCNDNFGWEWSISKEELELESYQVPGGVKGSWVPSLDDFEDHGWDVSGIDVETEEKMMDEVNAYMEDNDGVSEYYWNTIDMIAEDIFHLKRTTPAQ